MATIRNPATHYPFKHPFFKDSCVVKRNGRVLVEGTDFYFGHFYVRGTHRHGRTAHGSIWLYNATDLNGLTVTAEQLPHGEATQQQIDIEQTENGSLIAPVRFWDDVLKEHYYPPINIEFDEENWRGELELMHAIKSVGDTLVGKPATDDDLYEIAKAWLESLEDTFQRSPIHAHVINQNNPHKEEYNWIGALVRDGLAANASKLYGYSLEALTTYINDRSANATHLVPKLKKIGTKTLTSEMSFRNGVGFIASKDASLSVNKKTAGIASKGDISMRSHRNQPIKMSSGVNEMILYPDDRGLHFNGEQLLTRLTIGPHIPKPGAINDTFNFVSRNNLTIYGGGVEGDPAHFEWNKQPGEPSLLRVTKSRGNSKLIAAHLDLLKEYNLIYDDKLVIGVASINGMALGSNTTLTRAHVDLGNVENYSDAEMPISDAQATLLRQYAANDHTHPPHEFGIVDATGDKVGKVKFRRHKSVDDYDGSENTDYDVASPRHTDDLLVAVSDVTVGMNAVPPAAMKVVRFGNPGNAVIWHEIRGDTLVFHKELPYFVETNLYKTPITTLNLLPIFNGLTGIAYIYVTMDTTTKVVSYFGSMTEVAETGTTTLAGRVARRGPNDYYVVIRSRTRLEDFLELREHIDDPSAHGGNIDKNSAGLGQVANMEPSSSFQKITMENTFNEWHRFSHGSYSSGPATDHAPAGTAQPANVNALNGWRYDAVTDTIKMPHNCGSYAGFISPDKYSNFTLDTVLSSKEADDDIISIVLGFHVDRDGVEHTLSIFFRNNGGPKTAYLADNLMQTGDSDRYATTLWSTGLPSLSEITPWKDLGEKRVRVERKGDRFAVDIFQFSAWNGGDRNKLEETLVFWLDSPNIYTVRYPTIGSPTTHHELNNNMVSRGAKYKGSAQYGYGTHSQGDATFKSLLRPENDSRSYYATLAGLLDTVSFFSKMRVFVERNPIVTAGSNHLTAMPNGLPIKTYAGDVNVPWSNYMYDEPVGVPGLFETKRIGIASMTKDAQRPPASLLDPSYFPDTFVRPFDINTLTK